jgi:hypothetical protein
MNHIHHIHRIRSLAAVLAVAAIPTAALIAPAASGSTSSTSVTTTSTSVACPKGWGSLPEALNRDSRASLTNVRTGRHACFDRLVIDLNGRPAAGYWVNYVRNVYTHGAGELVPLRGGAKLQIIVRAPDHDSNYRPTYRPRNPRELTNVSGYRTFRQVASAGSFEGQTTIGLGVRARLPFRVFTLSGPGSGSRVVVDVAHHW